MASKVETKTETIVHLPLTSIFVDWSWNSRTIPRDEKGVPIKDEDYNELKATIENKGQDVPVIVRPVKGKADKYALVAGFRRMAVISELGWATIKATVKDVDDTEARSMNLRENTRGEVGIADRAWGVHQLYNQRALSSKDATITDTSIAQEVGWSVAFVNQMLTVMKTGAPDMLKMWRAHKEPLALKDMLQIVKKHVNQPKEQMAAYLAKLKEREDKDTATGRGSWVKTVSRQAAVLGEALGKLEAAEVISVEPKKMKQFDMGALFTMPETATSEQLKQIAGAMGEAYLRALEGYGEEEDSDDDAEDSVVAN